MTIASTLLESLQFQHKQNWKSIFSGLCQRKDICFSRPTRMITPTPLLDIHRYPAMLPWMWLHLLDQPQWNHYSFSTKKLKLNIVSLHVTGNSSNAQPQIKWLLLKFTDPLTTLKNQLASRNARGRSTGVPQKVFCMSLGADPKHIPEWIQQKVQKLKFNINSLHVAGNSKTQQKTKVCFQWAASNAAAKVFASP